MGSRRPRAGQARGAGVAQVLAALFASAVLCAAAPAWAELLYITEGNNLRRLDLATVDGDAPRSDVLIHQARDEEGGSAQPDPSRRDINGMICAVPDGSGRFVAGEDTGQPTPLPGWGVFSATGTQVGKLAATSFVDQAEPYGCVFDADGVLFTTELGNVGFGEQLGQLIRWFPPFEHFPGPEGAYPDTQATSENACKLAVDIGNASGIAMDAEGRVYVSSAGRGAIHRFSPPFPAGPTPEEGCGGRDTTGAPMADSVDRDVFYRGMKTFSGLAFAPGGNLYAASVFTGEILEIAPDGTLVRMVLEPDDLLPPFETGNPMGLAVDRAGNLYYADLDLEWSLPSIGPGPDGKVRRIRFDENGNPGPPEILMRGLSFPDGLGVFPGSLSP